MEKIRIHELKGNDKRILFFPDMLSIKSVNDEEAICWYAILNGEKEHEAMEKGEEYYKLYIRLFSEFKADYDLICEKKSKEWENSKEFSTLILNVSNDCNMICSYCFANHGTYASERGFMSKETAKDTIDAYCCKYDRIREIKFFGGEPLMNIDTIEFVCKYVCEKVASRNLKRLPRFKVITNGTIISERIISVAIKYGIHVVFSIDGPAEIHDKLRMYRGQHPTHRSIMDNMKEWRCRTNGVQPCSVEVTYTNEHIKNGLGIERVVEYFYDCLHMEKGQVNVSLVNLPSQHELAIPNIGKCWSEYAHAVVQGCRDGKGFYGDLKLMGLIHRLKNRKQVSEELCPAGKTWSAVSASGNVFPCLMFIDNKSFNMGKISSNIFDTDMYKEVVCRFFDCHQRESLPCKNCFANRVCNKCAGINYFLTGNISGTNPMQCASMKSVVNELICGIAGCNVRRSIL